MNKRILLFFLLILPFFVSAQQNSTHMESASTKGVFLDISGDFSIPLGAYKSSDKSNLNAGFSRSGFIGSITCDWMGK